MLNSIKMSQQISYKKRSIFLRLNCHGIFNLNLLNYEIKTNSQFIIFNQNGMSKQIELHVLNQFTIVKEMGSGAYGHVFEVQQKKTKKHYALKKVFDAFRNSIDAQRTYREVQILKQLNHQNIIKLYRVLKSKNKKDLYLLFEFMEADLHSIVGSNVLEKMHQVYVFYQILKALKYLHSAQLIHRDLKPSNILLNSQCNAKICDFGLIRTLNSQNDQEAVLSEEVATKWYRAPQLLLGSRSYKKPVDVWSFGCIVAQILTGKPMFAGDSTLNQLQKIMQYTGQISKDDIQALDSPVAEQLITQIKVKKRSFRQYFAGVDPDFWVLLKGALQFNPHKRMTIDQILALQVFDQFKAELDKLKVCSKAIRPKIDDNIRFGLKIYRDKIYQDIDKMQRPQLGSKQGKKLKEIQNLFNQGNQTKNNKTENIGKKRTSSQEKNIFKSSQKLKHRHFSVGNQNKQKRKILSQQKQKRTQSANPKYNSFKKSRQYHRQQLTSPYKQYMSQIQIKNKMMNNSQSMGLLKNFYRKNLIPSPNHKVRKITGVFYQHKQIQRKKSPQLEVIKNGHNSGNSKKTLKKVSSAGDKGQNMFNKKNILKSIGFQQQN